MSNESHRYRLLDRVIFPMEHQFVRVVIALDANRHLQYRLNDHQAVAINSMKLYKFVAVFNFDLERK